MKKTAYIILAALLAVSCSKSAPEVSDSTVTIILSGENSPASRTSFGTLSGTQMPFLWVAGDHLGMFVKDGASDVTGASNVLARIQASASSGNGPGYNTAVFTATVSGIEGGKSYDAGIYYPYDDAAGTSSEIMHEVPSTQVLYASGDSKNIGLDGTFAYAASSFETPADVTSTSPELSFTLQHKTSYVWLRIKAADATVAGYKLAGVTMTVPSGISVTGKTVYKPATDEFSVSSDGGNTVRLIISDKPVLSTSAYCDAYLVVVPADLAGKDVTFTYTLEKTDGSAIKTVSHVKPVASSSDAFSAGLTHRFTEEIPSADASGWTYGTSAIDLSAGGTANCYIVSAAGEYSFDASVIGNGERGILKPLTTTFFHTASAVISPASAELLWQTEPGLITGVALSGGRISFTKPSSAYGNAVIAAKDGAGNIIWSWHIWCTETGPVHNWVSTSVATNVYPMMDRNLGATYGATAMLDYTTDEGAALIKRCIGMIYQWGRKDPLLPVHEITATSSTSQFLTVYDASGAVKARPAPVSAENIKATGAIKATIENPMTTYFGTANTSRDWFSDKGAGNGPSYRGYYFWGNPQGYTYGGTSAKCTPVKTIYDPCPPGWMVPGGDALTAMYNTQNSNYGRLFRYDGNNSHTVFYPFYGATGWSAGTLTGVRSQFYLWTSTYSGANSAVAYNMYSQKTSSNRQNGLGASVGMDVRCTREI